MIQQFRPKLIDLYIWSIDWCVWLCVLCMCVFVYWLASTIRWHLLSDTVSVPSSATVSDCSSAIVYSSHEWHHLSVCLSPSVSVYLYVSVCQAVCLFVFMSVSLSVCVWLVVNTRSESFGSRKREHRSGWSLTTRRCGWPISLSLRDHETLWVSWSKLLSFFSLSVGTTYQI